MLAILRRMVISFAHAFPPPPDTITILPPPPRPQDQLPHCRGLAPRRVPHCSAPRHTTGCAAQARQRRLAPGPAARRGGGRRCAALRAWAARPRCSRTAALALVESAGTPSASRSSLADSRPRGLGRYVASSSSGPDFLWGKILKILTTKKFLGQIPG